VSGLARREDGATNFSDNGLTTKVYSYIQRSLQVVPTYIYGLLMVLCGGVMALLRSYNANDVILGMVVYGCMFLCYICVVISLDKTDENPSNDDEADAINKKQRNKTVTSSSIWIIAVLLRLVLLIQPILFSDDVYRYLWDGKVQSKGINPYIHAPNSPDVSHLSSDIIPQKVSVPNFKTVYPPIAQWVFTANHLLFGENVGTMKLLMSLAEIVALLTLWFGAEFRLSQEGRRSFIMFAWLPLVPFVSSLDAHIEIVAICIFIVHLIYLNRQKYVLAGIALGCAGLVKPQPLLMVGVLVFVLLQRVLSKFIRIIHPFNKNIANEKYSLPIDVNGGEKCSSGLHLLMIEELLPKGVLLYALSAIIVFVLGYLPYYESSFSMFEMYGIMAKRWYFNNPIFDVLHLYFTNENTHTICSVLLLIWLGVTLPYVKNIINGAFMLFLGITLCAPMIHPWYLLWLALFLPFRRSMAVIVFCGTVMLCNYTVWHWQSGNGWKQSWMILLLEWLPFYGLLILEWRNTKSVSVSSQSVSPKAIV
jgi:hypothetical protein